MLLQSRAGTLPPSPIAIIRAALRAAANAPTEREALDVAGEALRRLAEIARTGVTR
jgi:hypothetical protein